MTKEHFLVKNSDSCTSSSNDPSKTLSKKQAKKLARENRKNSTSNDDNEKLAKKISKITLQSNHEESKADDPSKAVVEEKDDKLPEMPKVTLHPSMYRRHMSESQVQSEAISNGEFKLKVYLMKTRRLLCIDCFLGNLEKFDEISFLFGIIQ